jgi:hypothetical protein
MQGNPPDSTIGKNKAKEISALKTQGNVTLCNNGFALPEETPQFAYIQSREPKNLKGL